MAGPITRFSARFISAALGAAGIRVRHLRGPDLRTKALQLGWGPGDPHMTRGTIFEHEIEGRFVRFFVTDEEDLLQHDQVLGRWYEREELDLIAAHYRGGAFVDVGAGAGNHSLYAGLVLDAPLILAFEPNPPARALCRYNLLLNGLAGRFVLHDVGLSDAPGPASVARSHPRNLGQTAIAPDPGGGLALRRGDDMIGEEPVGFIKIDVEGHELAVLAGLAGVIRRDRPAMLVEADPANRDAFLALIAAEGYRVVARIDHIQNSNFVVVPGDE